MPAAGRNIHGATRLTFDCLSGITSVVRQMHHTIASRAVPWPGAGDASQAMGGISGAVYSSIQALIAGLGHGADRSFALLNDANGADNPSTQVSALQAVLNGICGDHLEDSGNPLATPLHFIAAGQKLLLSGAVPDLAIANAGPHIAVFVHGLCLSPESWGRNGTRPLGDHLEAATGLTPVYLQYNTGRHISTNGQELAAELDKLVRAWPVPVESLTLVGHSMGGLVIRSACWYAERINSLWRGKVKRVLFLGTPHHGAPLEKAGHRLTVAMRAIPYLAPLDIGRHRSAGIKDLRFGNLLDEDWQNLDPDAPSSDNRRPVPLLEDIDYYFIVASIGRHEHDLRGLAFGDLLVRSGSAVGAHADNSRHLDIEPDKCRVLHQRNHFDLLTDSRVHQQVMEWFGADGIH